MDPEDHELEKLMQNLMRMENKEKDEWHAKVVNLNPIPTGSYWYFYETEGNIMYLKMAVDF